VFLPSSSVLRHSSRETGEPPAQPAAIDLVPVRKARPWRILVVEDAFLLVTLLQDMFDTLGWEMIGPGTRLVDALQLARHEVFDAALLDVNLDGAMSWDVAAVLKERGIPFVFGTGYNVSALLPHHLTGSPVIAKPYQLSELQQAIQRVTVANSPTSRPLTSVSGDQLRANSVRGGN
jgi:CheY-like chemotaxis protein